MAVAQDPGGLQGVEGVGEGFVGEGDLGGVDVGVEGWGG